MPLRDSYSSVADSLFGLSSHTARVNRSKLADTLLTCHLCRSVHLQSIQFILFVQSAWCCLSRRWALRREVKRFRSATVLGSPGAWLGVRGCWGTVGSCVTWHSITEWCVRKQKLSFRPRPLNLLQTHLSFNLLLWDLLASTGEFIPPPGQFCACPYCPGCVRSNH